MTRLFLLPGQNYTGPFNPIDEQYQRRYPPRDRLDRASREHDIGYDKLRKAGRNPYFRFNEADERYLKRIRTVGGFRASMARAAFTGKRKINELFGYQPDYERSREKRARRQADNIRNPPYRIGGVPVTRLADTAPTDVISGPELNLIGTAAGFKMKGDYVGKFSRPRPQRVSSYAKYGSRGESEHFGTSTQNNVNYLVFSSIQHNPFKTGSIVYHVGAAILRRIFKKHFEFEITDHNSPYATAIGTAWPNLPYSIDFWYREIAPTTGAINYGSGYTLSLAITETFRDLVTRFCENVLQSTNFGYRMDGNAFDRDFWGYRLNVPDVYGTLPTEVATISHQVVPIWNWRVQAYSTAIVALQNATASDTNNEDIDVINANPVEGKIFDFAGPYVDLRNYRGPMNLAADDNSKFLSFDMNGDGITVPSVNLTGSWVQMPTVDNFRNCVGIANSRLAPGRIRKSILRFKYEGTLHYLLRGLSRYSSQAGSYQRTNAFRSHGRCRMFAFERMMSTGVADNVKMNFQVQFFAGAMVTRSKMQTLDKLTAAAESTGVDAAPA